ncbi:hypothetical protein [Bradyrhizobium sp. HKCCYLS20291]|uniref:hypothetical protein n=1 Tax=Bradyrhizobium sp. HKCCYLS20291 TaxID=3420766 RepID=UPI003EBC6C39
MATFDLAFRMAQSTTDVELRARALISIAGGQAAAGLNEAGTTLDEALRVTRSIGFDMSREELLASIAVMRADDNHVAEASELLHSIEGPWLRSKVLITIAQSQGRSGLTKEAAATYRQSVQESRLRTFWAIGRSSILITIAGAQAEAGLLQDAGTTLHRARRIASSIRDEPSWFWNNRPFASPVVMCVQALADVAVAQADAGLASEGTATFERAHMIALSIDSEVDRADALIRLADALAKADRRESAAVIADEALQSVRSIAEEWRARMFSAIAAVQAAAGLAIEARATLDEAMVTAPSIKDEWQRALFWESIMATRLRLGDFREAMTLTLSITSDHLLRKAFDDLARAHLRAGHVTEALQLANAIEDRHWRSLIMEAAAEEHAKAGRFTEALATAASIEGEAARAGALASIALEQAKGGLTKDAMVTMDQALHVSESIAIGGWRADLLQAVVAQLCAIAGMLPE